MYSFVFGIHSTHSMSIKIEKKKVTASLATKCKKLLSENKKVVILATAVVATSSSVFSGTGNISMGVCSLSLQLSNSLLWRQFQINWSIKNSLQELVKFESFKMLCILLYKVAESNVVWVVLGFG